MEKYKKHISVLEGQLKSEVGKVEKIHERALEKERTHSEELSRLQVCRVIRFSGSAAKMGIILRSCDMDYHNLYA